MLPETISTNNRLTLDPVELKITLSNETMIALALLAVGLSVMGFKRR